MKNLLIILFGFSLMSLYAQEVKYIGAGNTAGFSIVGSTSGMNTNPTNTVNGNGMDADYMEASRLLTQSTLGYTESHVEDVLDMGIEGWINQQFEQPASYTSDVIYEILERTREIFYEHADREPTNGDLFGINYPRGTHFDYAWWHVNMNNEDLLRHRIAFALSEIFVISSDSQLGDIGEGLADYYDVLTRNAFGNFRELLLDVSLHPSMGFFLSHLNNPKTDLARNISPDENYAREIMQLFTVGLYELNKDGSRKKDENGKDIPTYGQDDIKGLAKVFTGLGGGGIRPERRDYLENNNMNVHPPYFGLDMYGISYTDPMKMYDNHHEPGEKHIINGFTIPDNQTGMQDLNMALDILFNHQNVGPFIGRRLIQRLVKSNPSPQYIERITRVFNNNGSGVRGDLKAVVKAILMDEEARSCEWQQDPNSGMLKEPFVRQLQFARSLNRTSNEMGYFHTRYGSRKKTKQFQLTSPTVFNFFLPDYQPVGILSDNDLYGPEFQIHDTHTSAGYLNLVHQMTYWEHLASSHGEFPTDWEQKVVRPVFTRFDDFNDDFESLLNHLDKFYGNGRLSDDTRNIIREAINPMKDWNYMYRDHTKTALFLFLISPDYTILK